MKNLWKFWMLTLLVTACASLGTVRSAAAQALAVGIVDEDRLAEGYSKYKQAVEALDTRAKDLDRQLEARELLTDTEGKRFDDLITKDAPTDAEKKELETLIDSGGGRRAEYMSLMGKATRTEADNNRMKELSGQSSANSLAVRSIQDKLYDQIKKKQESIDTDHTNRANQVIQQVAADRKLTLVWRKRAIIWNAASIDITGEVLTRLNR
jgi:Skp family chaperone for outer membrane proteins